MYKYFSGAGKVFSNTSQASPATEKCIYILLRRRRSISIFILIRYLSGAEEPQATASEALAQGSYVAVREGFELSTLRTKGDESTYHTVYIPMSHHAQY